MKFNLTEDAERPDKFGTAKSVRPLHLAKCNSQFDGVKSGSVAPMESLNWSVRMTLDRQSCS